MKTPQTAEEYEVYAMCVRLKGKVHPVYSEAAAIVAQHLRGDNNANATARVMFFANAEDLKRSLDREIELQIKAGRI